MCVGTVVLNKCLCSHEVIGFWNKKQLIAVNTELFGLTQW